MECLTSNSLLSFSHSKSASLFPYSPSLIPNANCESSCSKTAAWKPDQGLLVFAVVINEHLSEVTQSAGMQVR